MPEQLDRQCDLRCHINEITVFHEAAYQQIWQHADATVADEAGVRQVAQRAGVLLH